MSSAEGEILGYVTEWTSNCIEKASCGYTLLGVLILLAATLARLVYCKDKPNIFGFCKCIIGCTNTSVSSTNQQATQSISTGGRRKRRT